MKDFFTRVSAFFGDIIEKGRLLSKKQIIIIITAIVAVIAAIVVAVCLVNKSNDPMHDYKAVADSYCEKTMKYDYYGSFDYTLFAANGIDSYYDYYLGDLDDSELTDQDRQVIVEVTDVFKQDIINYVSYNGFTDFDGFMTWFFDKALTVISVYEGEEYMKKGVVLGVLEQTIQYYADTLSAADQKKYADEGYNPAYTLKEEKNFTEEEVQKYISNKNEDQLLAFEKSGIDTSKIKAVKKMTYTVSNNGTDIKEIVFYLIQVDSKWMVDITAVGVIL